jgi:hypothetical protein
MRLFILYEEKSRMNQGGNYEKNPMGNIMLIAFGPGRA